MRGSSARSLSEALGRADAVFRAEGVQRDALARELFEIADAIDSSNRAVRLLSDPGRPADVKQAAARGILEGRVSPQALELTLEVVSRRWSEQEDILEGLELLGLASLLSLATDEGSLAQVEEELVQVARLLDSSSDLTAALDEARGKPERRSRIIAAVLEGRVHRITAAIAARAVARTVEAKPAHRIESFARFAAALRSQRLAVVESAKPLSPQQTERLSGILERIYGSALQLSVELVPDLIGGLRIRIGDDLYDANVLARLAKARSHLVH